MTLFQSRHDLTAQTEVALVKIRKTQIENLAGRIHAQIGLEFHQRRINLVPAPGRSPFEPVLALGREVDVVLKSQPQLFESKPAWLLFPVFVGVRSGDIARFDFTSLSRHTSGLRRARRLMPVVFHNEPNAVAAIADEASLLQHGVATQDQLVAARLPAAVEIFGVVALDQAFREEEIMRAVGAEAQLAVVAKHAPPRRQTLA